MTTHYEWTIELDAMLTALRAINRVLMDLNEGGLLEETAAKEANRITNRLAESETWDKAYLIDALKEAGIDLLTNSKGSIRCESCRGKGWLVLQHDESEDNNKPDWRWGIERCDNCRVMTDSQAREIPEAQQSLRKHKGKGCTCS